MHRGCKVHLCEVALMAHLVRIGECVILSCSEGRLFVLFVRILMVRSASGVVDVKRMFALCS